jgi:hypothetical protein
MSVLLAETGDRLILETGGFTVLLDELVVVTEPEPEPEPVPTLPSGIWVPISPVGTEVWVSVASAPPNIWTSTSPASVVWTDIEPA